MAVGTASDKLMIHIPVRTVKTHLLCGIDQLHHSTLFGGLGPFRQLDHVTRLSTPNICSCIQVGKKSVKVERAKRKTGHKVESVRREDMQLTCFD